MWQTEASTEITMPIEQVYTYLCDFTHHPEWSAGVTSIAQTSNGHVGVGTEFRAAETVPAKFVSYSRITALEPPRRIAWEAWDDRMMRTRWEFELAAGNGGTRLIQRCAFQPTSVLGTVILNLMRKRQIPKENQQSLERIKDILERGGAPR